MSRRGCQGGLSARTAPSRHASKPTRGATKRMCAAQKPIGPRRGPGGVLLSRWCPESRRSTRVFALCGTASESGRYLWIAVCGRWLGWAASVGSGLDPPGGDGDFGHLGGRGWSSKGTMLQGNPLSSSLRNRCPESRTKHKAGCPLPCVGPASESGRYLWSASSARWLGQAASIGSGLDPPGGDGGLGHRRVAGAGLVRAPV